MSSSHWRSELFFKQQSALQSKVIPFLTEHGIHRVNLTNKTKDDKLLESASKIWEAIPKADVCLHYSIKWNYNGGEDKAMHQLESFLKDLDSLKGEKSVLLLSGGGKKKRLDTVKALQKITQQKEKTSVPLHVAFNPYFPAAEDSKEERKRMKQKLATGLVSGVWLQTGSDVQKLEDGLKFLRQESSEDLPLYGSVFLPDKKLLAQMKYRPWNGVFLSEEYLSSVPKAMTLTKQLLACYEKYNVIPLLETSLQTKQDMQAARDLLETS